MKIDEAAPKIGEILASILITERQRCFMIAMKHGHSEAAREIIGAKNPLHCQHCGGSGNDASSWADRPEYSCKFCHGSGRAADVSSVPNPPQGVATEQCPDCQGTGYAGGSGPHETTASTCEVCHGNGFVTLKMQHRNITNG